MYSGRVSIKTIVIKNNIKHNFYTIYHTVYDISIVTLSYIEEHFRFIFLQPSPRILDDVDILDLKVLLQLIIWNFF